MSELSAIRNAIRAEREIIKTERAVQAENAVKMPPISTVVPPKKANVVKTATGSEVDISRGYNVRGPDGTKIPFNKDTPLEKAKEWTKNFYNPGEVDIQLDQSFGNRIALKSDEGSFIDFRKKPGAMQITLSKVNQKGTGVGAGLYRKLFEHAEKEGSVVYSDKAMSQASIAVWERFKALGYPIQANPRKRMMSGGFEHATDPNQPLFMFDPKKKARSPTKAVDDPVAEIDKNKPHTKVAGPYAVPEEMDRKIYDSVRRTQGLTPEKREELVAKYLDYKNADDPEAKAQLQSELEAMLPKSESK